MRRDAGLVGGVQGVQRILVEDHPVLLGRSGLVSHNRVPFNRNIHYCLFALAGPASPEGTDAPRYAYVYGIALNSAGRTAGALEVLRRAHEAAPVDREILFGLATISRDSGAGPEALRYARKLAELVPYDPGVRQLVAALERGVD